MLKATIDSSLLNSFSKEGFEPATDYPFTPQLTTLLTGLHWEDGIPEKLKEEKLASKILFPWNWKAPLKIRIYWLDISEGEGGHSWYRWLMDFNQEPKYSEITIEIPNIDSYEKDIKLLNEYFSGILNSTIWKRSVFNGNQIQWDETKNVIVKDDFETNEKDSTGFLKSAIGQFAQKLTPINQFLDLVLFSNNNEVKVPSEAKYFVAFPVGGEWWNIDKPFPEPTSGPFTGDFCYLSYSPKPMIEISNEGQATFKVKSTITELEAKKYQSDSPIQLRDKDGNFQGTVDIKAFDIDDWTDTLLDGLAVHFDLPALMLQFVKENKIKDVTTLGKINDFIWATIRDSIGYGYMVASDGTSVVDSVVKLYCEETIGKLNEIGQDETKRKNYFERYDTKVSELVGTLDPKTKEPISGFRKADKDKFNTLNLWNEFIKQLNYIPSKYPELDLGIVSLITEFKSVWDRISLNNYTDEELKFEEDENKEKENKYTRDWKRVFEILNNNSVQSLIITLQWQEVDEVKSFVSSWQTELNITDEKIKKYLLFNEIEKIGELKHQQQYATVSKHKTEIIDKDNPIEKDNIPKIIDKVIEEIKSYFTYRINPQGQDEKYFPSNLNQPITLIEFGALLNGKVKPQIESAVTKCIQKPFEIPPSVFLKVDSHVKVQKLGTKPDSDEDLNDEIGGHIVLIRRGDKLGSNKFVSDWRYLNRVKVDAEYVNEKEPETNPKTFESPVKKPFTESYIVPAFIPESSEIGKKPYLELRNERLSLIAGHNTFDDSSEVKKEAYQRLIYNFDDKENGAYAFWYGYNYKLAGFVALNSGVLPEILRDNDNWNIPKKYLGTDDINHATNYLHLRRVPVSKVRVEPISKVLSPPKGLLPLAFELPEWKGDNIIKEEKGKDFEQTHYLLAEGNLSQKEITLELKKPTTSFWNWYAWLGDESNKPIKIRDKNCKVEIDSEGNEVIKTLAAIALDKELKNRVLPISERKKENLHNFWDPAVDDKIKVAVTRLFPTVEIIGHIYVDLKYEKRCNKEPNIETEDELKYLSEVTKDLKIEVGSKTATDENSRIITIAQGDIIQVNICGRISQNHFQSDTSPVNQNAKFYSWMKNSLTVDKNDSSFYLIHPVELWFEAAIPLAVQNDVAKKIEKELFKPIELWKSIGLNQTADKVNCSIIKTKDNYNKLAYASRIEVKHQIWSWNGRLEESEILQNSVGKNESLDPDSKIPKTTEAMKWEAWAFSDRPDYSALVQDANLLASRDGIAKQPLPHTQILFTDHRPNEEKALYYRFTAIAHSRYEKLGKEYQIPVEANIELEQNVNNPWKRYLRKSSKTKQLPKPSIRFVIPLTRSIQECNERETINEDKTEIISAASLLIVLNDRWFTEAGLAEQLEIGIDVLKNPTGVDHYIQAGNDPIMDGTALSQVKTDANTSSKDYPYIEENGDTKVVVFKPKGPAGLTFEPKMQTPLVRGSSFILNIPDVTGLLNSPDKMKAWAMMQIAVRRTLRKELSEEGISIDALRSGWTAKEWVQFLPAVDSFIPKVWRESVRKEGALKINFSVDNIIFSNMNEAELPVFDDTFEERMQRYLVLTETVYDIGGQPCESYKATIKCNRDSKGIFTFELNHPRKEDVDLTNLKAGFLRMILVRVDIKQDEFKSDKTDIWSRLFGENAAIKADMNLIQNDPTAALPLVSERIPFKNLNQ